MKHLKIGSGFAMFVLFFGIALLEAFRSMDFLVMGFWIFIGLLFLVMDNVKEPTE